MEQARRLAEQPGRMRSVADGPGGEKTILPGDDGRQRRIGERLHVKVIPVAGQARDSLLMPFPGKRL
jgi:hypothetical protein